MGTATRDRPFKGVEVGSDGVVHIEIEMDKPAGVPWSEWGAWALFSADWHYDSAICFRQIIEWELSQAKKRDAIVLVGGDVLDAMQGRGDPRRSKDDLRPEYLGGNYYDLLVDDVAQFLAPHAHRIPFIYHGNHETKITQFNETAILLRVAEQVRHLTGVTIPVLGLTGWIHLSFRRANEIRSIVGRHHHGWGGGGPVTDGFIDFNRVLADSGDLDFVWMGHIHKKNHKRVYRPSLNNRNELRQRSVLCIRTASYKAESHKQYGWLVETGKLWGAALGGQWVRYGYRANETPFYPAGITQSLLDEDTFGG